MAIVDYDGLKSDVTAYLARTDAAFVAAFPSMVAQAEERLYSGFGRPGDQFYTPPLRVKSMEVNWTVTVTSGVGDLPGDCLDVRVIYDATADGIDPPFYVPPNEFHGIAANSAGGNLAYYTIEANQIKTWPTWTGTLTLVYFKRFNALTPTGSDFTNNLLIAQPTIWTVAARAEGYAFIRNTDAEIKEVTRLAGMITAANGIAAGNRHVGRKRVRLPSGGIS